MSPFASSVIAGILAGLGVSVFAAAGRYLIKMASQIKDTAAELGRVAAAVDDLYERVGLRDPAPPWPIASRQPNHLQPWKGRP